MRSIVQYPNLENLTKLELKQSRTNCQHSSLRAINTISLYQDSFPWSKRINIGNYTHIANNQFKYLPSCKLFIKLIQKYLHLTNFF